MSPSSFHSEDRDQINWKLDEAKLEEGGHVPKKDSHPSSDINRKLAADGHTLLIPQPSDDPNDPLNWSKGQKTVILIIISISAFLADFGSSTGAITNLVQPETWDLPEATINHALVGNLFMLGVGGIATVVLSAYFGRLPVLWWFSIFAFATAVWSAASPSFESFMAARILHGFFATVAQAGGLMFIKDMYFFHEHPRKINVWQFAIVNSPYLGPLVASFVTWKTTWRWCYWIITILWGVVIVLTCCFVDETYYDRRLPRDQQPARNSRVLRLLGVEQWRSRNLRSSFLEACQRPIVAIMKLPVLIISIYYVFTFAWVIGLNAATGVFLAEVYHFGSVATGLYYFAPIVATVLGEFFGYWAFDFFGERYMRKHHGHFEPEIRLVPAWIAALIMCLGVLVLGFSLENAWHYMFSAIAWGCYVFGIMVCTTAINAYLLDCYPEASGEVAAWINFDRTVGGFIITYYEVDWVLSMGASKALAIQASIILIAFSFIVFLQFYGKTLRLKQGPVHFKTY